MRLFGTLSQRQRAWLITTVLIAVAIIVIGVMQHEEATLPLPSEITVEMSIKDIALRLNVTGKSLARDLGLPLETAKNKPIKTLGITEDTLGRATEHILGHRDSGMKYYVFVAMVLLGWVYLVRLGRPDGSAIANRKDWYPRWPYVLALIVTVAVCGFLLGKSPNPMEGTVKVLKSILGLYPSIGEKVVAFIFFAVLAIVGNKLICGWACPFGALQELIYSIPILTRLKKRKVPFAVSNTIRSMLFIVVVLILFGVVGGRTGLVVYHYLNPFNLFDFDIETIWVGATILGSLVVSFGFYRPFCQFVCPFGLVSWLFERISIFRVRIDRDRCINCGACVDVCPTDAAKGRVAGKVFPADCFSCGRCLNVCPTDAIHYVSIVGNKSIERLATNNTTERCST